MKMLRHLDLPPVWLIGFMAFAWGIARLLPLVALPTRVIGLWILLAGIALILWSGWFFLTHRTPIEPRRKPRALITHGPYRVNRNPIYTGLLLVLIGTALRQEALSALLIIPVFPWIITRRFILEEEEALRRAFGTQAEQWFARSRRW